MLIYILTPKLNNNYLLKHKVGNIYPAKKGILALAYCHREINE